MDMVVAAAWWPHFSAMPAWKHAELAQSGHGDGKCHFDQSHRQRGHSNLF
jgi:hypothetical protein